MAQYKHLPLYKTTYDLLLELMQNQSLQNFVRTDFLLLSS